ncbi:protein NRT1/ PTR FAMILY 8.1-like [Melia azedarach]|uniref:Protein NRT1/ PTR FAMILY 8.1-like n=1 Tax=Melia azedarach TaxID=155640 RepID=A0ACC1WT16_MELAZ|nr:protein NRT1/ PTR FAMILY 8.1-like [Melia azedarach]
MEKEANVLTLVTNGSVDFQGRTADKQTTGGWKASPFIIVNEVAERLAFYAIAVNMGAYLVREMHQSLPSAATHVSDWVGAAFVLTILGAFMADAYLGRFKTIVFFSCIYSVGMVLLTVSAAIDNLRPPACTAKPCVEANGGQNAFLFCALALIAIGTGGIKPCVSSFGADQYDEADEKEVQLKYEFFNWFFFAINMGALLGITVMVYLREQKGWVVGFGVPTGAMICSIIVLCAGVPYYRNQKPTGSPLTRFLQVLVASIRNHFRGVQVTSEADLYEVKTKESAILGARKLPHTAQYRFLDKAAVVRDPESVTKSRWKLCTVTQKKRREEHPALYSMSVFWLFPQFFLVGSAEVFTYVGQLEFFYDEATDGTRSISSAIFLSTIGIGSWLNGAIVKIVEHATGGEERGWLRNDLNKSKLDYYYWLLTGMNGFNFLLYLLAAWRYKGKGTSTSVRDEAMIELGAQVERDDDNKEDFQSEENVSTLVTNGSVDFRGRITDKQTTGGWKASPVIIVNEVAERLAYYAIAANLGAYLVREMHQSLPSAATHVSNSSGAAFVLTILGAFMADAYLGQFKMIVVFSCIYSVKCWVVGFGVSAAAMIFSVIVIAAGLPYYRYQKPMGSPSTRFLQVMVSSVKSHLRGVEVGLEADLYELKIKEPAILGARKLPHSAQYRFFDKAAVVEELKSFIRVLPIWATTISLAISFAQLSTFFLYQAAIMDRNLGSNFTIPTGSITIFSAINAIILVPIYEKVMVPILRKYTGYGRGITSLQRMGIGLFFSIFALGSAALIEKKRRDEHPALYSMSVFWLFPQFFLVGSAEVFTYVGQLEFFYDETTDGTRSISSAIFLSTIGIGSWLNGAIVKIVEHATGGEEKGWLRNDLNKSKLDYYYWLLTGINGFNFLLYLLAAWRYKGKGTSSTVRDETIVELGGQVKKDDDKEDFHKCVKL